VLLFVVFRNLCVFMSTLVCFLVLNFQGLEDLFRLARNGLVVFLGDGNPKLYDYRNVGRLAGRICKCDFTSKITFFSLIVYGGMHSLVSSQL